MKTKISNGSSTGKNGVPSSVFKIKLMELLPNSAIPIVSATGKSAALIVARKLTLMRKDAPSILPILLIEIATATLTVKTRLFKYNCVEMILVPKACVS